MNYFADGPTEVQLGLFVIGFYSVNEQTMVSQALCCLPNDDRLMAKQRQFKYEVQEEPERDG